MEGDDNVLVVVGEFFPIGLEAARFSENCGNRDKRLLEICGKKERVSFEVFPETCGNRVSVGFKGIFWVTSGKRERQKKGVLPSSPLSQVVVEDEE